MTKTDKQFIARLFHKLDKKIDNRFGTLDRKIDDRFSTLDQKIDHVDSSLRGEIKRTTEELGANFMGLATHLHDELMMEIRHEGVLREQGDHNIQILQEGYAGLNERMERMATSMASIEKNTDMIPVLWTVVESHGRRITALEKG